jgi:hypothetical protein
MPMNIAAAELGPSYCIAGCHSLNENSGRAGIIIALRIISKEKLINQRGRRDFQWYWIYKNLLDGITRTLDIRGLATCPFNQLSETKLPV